MQPFGIIGRECADMWSTQKISILIGAIPHNSLGKGRRVTCFAKKPSRMEGGKSPNSDPLDIYQPLRVNGTMKLLIYFVVCTGEIHYNTLTLSALSEDLNPEKCIYLVRSQPREMYISGVYFSPAGTPLWCLGAGRTPPPLE